MDWRLQQDRAGPGWALGLDWVPEWTEDYSRTGLGLGGH